MDTNRYKAAEKPDLDGVKLKMYSKFVSEFWSLLVNRARIFIFLITMGCLMVATLKADDLAEAKSAYDAGRYSDAVSLLTAAALKGDPEAECGLGIMYEHG